MSFRGRGEPAAPTQPAIDAALTASAARRGLPAWSPPALPLPVGLGECCLEGVSGLRRALSAAAAARRRRGIDCRAPRTCWTLFASSCFSVSGCCWWSWLDRRDWEEGVCERAREARACETAAAPPRLRPARTSQRSAPLAQQQPVLVRLGTPPHAPPCPSCGSSLATARAPRETCPPRPAAAAPHRRRARAARPTSWLGSREKEREGLRRLVVVARLGRSAVREERSESARRRPTTARRASAPPEEKNRPDPLHTHSTREHARARSQEWHSFWMRVKSRAAVGVCEARRGAASVCVVLRATKKKEPKKPTTTTTGVKIKGKQRVLWPVRASVCVCLFVWWWFYVARARLRERAATAAATGD